jgi:asparagine synthase (glutamine-hydrolysing)
MCGITGIFGINKKPKMTDCLLEQMTKKLTHRGPDSVGFRIGDGFALGHCRLKIIDLEGGVQPMSSPDGKVWVSYNGEIYNFREIRDELIGLGYDFKTKSDTEVLVRSYEAFGIDCVKHFNGMFAIALVDLKKNKFFLIRDRLGIKPLYYTIKDGCIIFGSEIKSILAYPGVKREINPYGVSSYLSYRYVLGEETLFRGIFSLSPGRVLTVANSSFKIDSYWEAPIIIQKEDKGESFYIEKIRELLGRAVKYRMISDVPLGAYLSGGLDSSLIVSLMAEYANEPIKTFTIGFQEEGFNEFEFSRMVASRYRTDHKEILLSSSDYIDLIPKLISFKDSPLSVPNEVPLYEMSKELKKYITVVLSGEGADELFGGYGRIFRSPFDYERVKLMRENPGVISGDVKNMLVRNLLEKYKDLDFNTIQDHFLTCYNYLSLEDKRCFLQEEFNLSLNGDEKMGGFFRSCFKRIEGLSQYDQYMWIFEKIHLVGLLHRLDMTTMAVAVEARVPFVDHNLVEFGLSMPFKYKLRWKSLLHKTMATLVSSDQISERYDTTKYILRESFRDKLPETIISREKVGFPVPLHKWFGEKFNGYAKEILLDKRTKRRGILDTKQLEKSLNEIKNFEDHKFGIKIFMLVNLELWARIYIDQCGA